MEKMSNEEKFVHELVESGDLQVPVFTYGMLMEMMRNVFGKDRYGFGDVPPGDCCYKMLGERVAFKNRKDLSISELEVLMLDVKNCIETIYKAFEKYMAYKEFCDELMPVIGGNKEVLLGVGLTSKDFQKGSLPVIDINKARALLGIEYWADNDTFHRGINFDEYFKYYKESYEQVKDLEFSENNPVACVIAAWEELNQMSKKYHGFYRQESQGRVRLSEEWYNTYGCKEIRALISDEDKSQVKTPWQKVASAGEKTGNKNHGKKNHHAEISNQELKDVKARDKNQLKNDLGINL